MQPMEVSPWGRKQGGGCRISREGQGEGPSTPPRIPLHDPPPLLREREVYVRHPAAQHQRSRSAQHGL